MNSLPKTVTRQHRDCDLNPGPSVPESSTLTTRLPSHPTHLTSLLASYDIRLFLEISRYVRIRNPIYTVARQQAYFTVALPGVKPNQIQLNGTTSCIGLCPKLPRYTRRSAYNNSQRFARHLVVCAFECRIINRTLELCFVSASNTGPTVCHRQLCPSYSPRETYSITCCIYTVTSQSTL